MTQALVVLAIAVHAVQLPPVPPPPPAAQPPVTAPATPDAQLPPTAQEPTAKPIVEIARVTPLTPAELQARHDNIGNMESLLAQAVVNGARSFQVSSAVTVGFVAGQKP